tara:strand:- start:5785 stop:6438 length:654 start_codon:yes stop_codon:yes gene_type:complete
MITSSLAVLAFTWNPKHSVTMARTMWSPFILWVCGVKLKVKGLENVNPEHSYVLVSNHQSYLDIPVLFRAITVNLYFVAKKELKKIPFLGWYMMATGMIFIDRTNRNKAILSLKKAARLIQNGKSVIMFPEGTRSKDGYLADFKKGPFMLARQADVNVLPVGISEPEGHFRVNKLRRITIEVNVGQPIPANSVDVNELIQSAHDEVAVLSNRTKSLK